MGIAAMDVGLFELIFLTLLFLAVAAMTFVGWLMYHDERKERFLFWIKERARKYRERREARLARRSKYD